MARFSQNHMIDRVGDMKVPVYTWDSTMSHFGCNTFLHFPQYKIPSSENCRACQALRGHDGPSSHFAVS